MASRRASAALPGRLVEEDGAGGGHVERVHVRRHGDFHGVIARGQRGLRKSGAFRAEDETAVTAQIDGSQLLCTGPRMGGEASNAARAQGGEFFDEVVHMHHGLLEDGAHRSGNGATLEGAAARLAHDEEGHAKGRAASDDCAEIFRTAMPSTAASRSGRGVVSSKASKPGCGGIFATASAPW